MSKKVFSTIDRQIQILSEERNLTILDEERAKQLLARYGYYEIINGYKDFLIDKTITEKEQFIDGATFEHIFSLFELDKRIRKFVLDSTLEIEASLRTATAYTVAELYGDEEDKYLNRNNYRPGKENIENGVKNGYKIDQLISKFKKICQDDVQPMKHYREVHRNIPPWIMIKGTSFGNLINFIKLQKPKAKNRIFSMASGLPEHVFEMMPEYKDFYIDALFLCHAFRNRSAHTGRMYNYQSTNAQIRYNDVFHGKYSISEADYRNNKGVSCLNTLLLALDMFDNKTAKLNLTLGINFHLNEHLKKYPDDKEFILVEMGFDKDYKLMNFD